MREWRTYRLKGPNWQKKNTQAKIEKKNNLV